jgi:hypothetical protein
MRLLCCLAGLLLLQATAWGAEPGAASREQEAAAHYGQGLELFKAGDMPLALKEFEAAYALVPRFEALFNIAVAHRKLGHYAAAYDAFTRYLAEGGERLPAERRQQVADELHELDRFVAHVTVTVEGAPAQIELDGQALGKSPLPVLHLDAGRHELRATRAGSADALEVRTLAPGETVTVLLRPFAPPSSRPPTHVRLSVATTPPGADLELDDQPVGQAPWSGEVKRGWHLLRADLDGYLPQTARLDLQGEERTVQLELEQKRWYHQWYVWTAVAVVVAGAAATTTVLVVTHH